LKVAGLGLPADAQPATFNLQPRLDVLLETFLQLQTFRDHDHRSVRQQAPQQDGEKRLGGPIDAPGREHASILQALDEGSRNGSLCCPSDQIACRVGFQIMRQASENVAAQGG
jgi:hypothetical protein